jgi:hypothetical protein
LISQLRSEFSVKDLGVLHYFLGIEVSSPSSGSLLLRQRKYALELLARAGMLKCTRVILTASAEEFRAVVQELTGRHSNVADHDAPGGPSYYSSSSSSSASYGRVSTTTAEGSTGAAGERALSQAMVPAYMTVAGAMLPPFQSLYDQTGGVSLLYGQDW